MRNVRLTDTTEQKENNERDEDQIQYIYICELHCDKSIMCFIMINLI